MKKILVVDDHPIVRKGLKSIIEDEDSLDCTCFEASNEAETMKIIASKSIDLIVLDISLGTDSGFEILSRLKHIRPEIKILMISALSEDIYADKSIKSGANGFIAKEVAPEELIFAIKKILNGYLYLSNNITDKFLLSQFYGKEKKPHENLSKRELDVLFLIAKGTPGNKIAEKLFISNNTVSTYRARIMKKLDLKTNVDLIKYCIDNEIC